MIEVSADGEPSLYRQLFRIRDEVRSEKMGVISPVLAEKRGNPGQFGFDAIFPIIQSIKSELGDRVKALGFGQTARLRLRRKVDNKSVDLDFDLEPQPQFVPGSGPLLVLETRTQENGVKVTMRMKDGVIEISVNPETDWERCEIRAIEVVRWVKDLPRYSQELYRLRDY